MQTPVATVTDTPGTKAPASAAKLTRVAPAMSTQTRKVSPAPSGTADAVRRVRLTPPAAPVTSHLTLPPPSETQRPTDLLLRASLNLERAVARLLAHRNVAPNERGQELFEAYLDFVKKGGYGNANPGSRPLVIAARNGDSALVEQMLDHVFIEPAANNSEALRVASASGHTDVVRLLLKDRRSNPAALEGEALIEASRLGHVDIVNLLLEDSRVTPAVRGNEAVGVAYEAGHIDVLRRLAEDARASLPHHVAFDLGSYSIKDAVARLESAADEDGGKGDGSSVDEAEAHDAGVRLVDTAEHDDAEDITMA